MMIHCGNPIIFPYQAKVVIRNEREKPLVRAEASLLLLITMGECSFYDKTAIMVEQGNPWLSLEVSESGYKGMYQYSDAYTFYTIVTADSEVFCKAAEDLILSEDNTVIIQDVAQMTRLNRNIAGIIMLFGFGFIAMLSLIAVTSVITTISTGMALRRQEFAMLYSAGMTPSGMSKMLNLESLL